MDKTNLWAGISSTFLDWKSLLDFPTINFTSLNNWLLNITSSLSLMLGLGTCQSSSAKDMVWMVAAKRVIGWYLLQLVMWYIIRGSRGLQFHTLTTAVLMPRLSELCHAGSSRRTCTSFFLRHFSHFLQNIEQWPRFSRKTGKRQGLQLEKEPDLCLITIL